MWSGISGDSKLHLVNWAKVCKPMQLRGLGIRCLRSFNSALLGKWLWRYGMKTDALWRRIIEAKYGNVWGDWCTKKVTSAYGVSLWRFIRSGWLNFSKLLLYDVGDGTRVKFWKHVWCGDRTLQEAFQKLYCISRTKDSSIADVLCWFGGRIHWDAKFRRSPQDWEQESVDLFMDMVYSSTVRGVGS